MLFFTLKKPKTDGAEFTAKDERIDEQTKLMTESDTPEKKIDVLLRTKEIMQKEALYDV